MAAYAIRVTHMNHDVPYYLKFDTEGNVCFTNKERDQALFDSEKTAKIFIENCGHNIKDKPYLQDIQFEIIGIEG